MYAQTVADVGGICVLLVIIRHGRLSGKLVMRVRNTRLCLWSITLLKKNLHGLDGSDYESNKWRQKMIFSDERELWYAETENLARQLANKSEEEIMSIFDRSDVIQLKASERPNGKIIDRIMLPFTWVILLILCCVKYIVTGSWYIDSWVKRSKVLRIIADSLDRC